MATNTGKGYRVGAVDNRCQTYNPKNDTWSKRDSATGKIFSCKNVLTINFPLFVNIVNLS